MLHSRSDAELERYAEVTAKNIAADLFRASVDTPAQPRFISSDIHTWGRYVQVVDARGNVVRRSDALASQPLPVSAETLMRAQRGLTTFETIEGLAQGGELHPLQKAFLENTGLQCGICTPGFLMSAKALLDGNPKPDETEIRHWLAGNLCRCTGYDKLVRSVMSAAEALAKGARS